MYYNPQFFSVISKNFFFKNLLEYKVGKPPRIVRFFYRVRDHPEKNAVINPNKY
jgi:hypothetical protein